MNNQITNTENKVYDWADKYFNNAVEMIDAYIETGYNKAEALAAYLEDSNIGPKVREMLAVKYR